MPLTRCLKIVMYTFLVLLLVAAMPQAVDETLEVSLSLTGKMDADRRVSDNYSMTIQRWPLQSNYTQSSEYTLVREPSGKIGGVPTFFYGAMQDHNMLFEPTMSPFDIVKFDLTGSIKVTGCVNVTDHVAAHSQSGFNPGGNSPAGLPPGVAALSRMGKVEEVANRGLFYFERCGTQGDKILVFYLPPPGLFPVPRAGPLPCNDEYSYEREAGEDAQYQPHLLTPKFKTALMAECSAGASQPTEEMAFLGSVTWSQLKDGTPARLQKTYQGSEGVQSGDEPWYQNKLDLTLEITPGGDIHAEPGGPYTLNRGETVTLDGTRSVPSKGHRIQSYEWDLTPQGTPEGCAGIGTPKRMSGATVSFVALCSVKVKLTVKDDGGKEDDGGTEIIVTPRPWKTEFTTADQIKHANFTFVQNAFVFGYNRCTNHVTETNIDTADNHWYEPRGGQGNDYEAGTGLTGPAGSFWLDQVNDSGPFAGVFYVSKSHFKIERTLWANKKLYLDGEVYDINTGPERQVNSCSYGGQSSVSCKFGRPVIDRLRRGVQEHELLHSTLAEEKLRSGKDPAKDVESSMGRDRVRVKDNANGFLRTAASDMSNASDESKVRARMPAEFRPGGCIDFPAWDSAARGGCYYYFSSFADKGEKTAN